MKKKMNVFQKSSIDNSLDQIHIMSMSVGNNAFAGTGAHKNRKYDKKLRRQESKKLCKDF